MRHEWLAVLVVAAAWSVAAPGNALAQISPGPLSTAHATLDGPLNCTKCHAGGGVTMESRCLSCHREIEYGRTRNRGLHARTGRATCASCHPDHAGRNFALVKWPGGSPDRFDHDKAGYTLTGKHLQATCAKCHTQKLRVSPAAALGPPRTTVGWVGLDTECASCHVDVHRGDVGTDCAGCHETEAWSPAPRFDHARTKYALTGKHTSVACGDCHTRAPAARGTVPTVVTFKPVQHSDCASCHRDAHGGRLSGTCASCHTTDGFVGGGSRGAGGRAFAHDRTRFPLKGRHATARCVSCHEGYPGRVNRPAFATCASCHADPHRGAATLTGAAVDCASCHTVTGFAPSTFTVSQHARTAYPLQGRHTAVACAGCHTKTSPVRAGQPADVLLRPRVDQCEPCHAPAHGDQLARRPAACMSCHAVGGWTPSTFTAKEHASTSFALTGKHATTACGSCHAVRGSGKPAGRNLGSANVALAIDGTSCTACHSDPHGGRYAGTPGATCSTCHDTRAFVPSTVTVAQHAAFAFRLEGAHLAVTCTACHKGLGQGRGASLLTDAKRGDPRVYNTATRTCVGCHSSPHGSQFDPRADRGTCEGCHDVSSWRPASRFVHEAAGGFVLGAAHARVSCAQCHVAPAGAPASARVWRGVPRSCESCHRRGTR